MKAFWAAALCGLFLLNGPIGGKEARSETTGDTALLLIDIQMFYFPGGKMELVDPLPAARQAGKLLAAFRDRGAAVYHIRHHFEPGGDIHPEVRPIEGETIIGKNHVNAFRDTGLEAALRKSGIRRLVVAGMQTHMCVEAAVRAAADLGLEVILIKDACATRDLEFNGRTVPASDVHASTLAALDRTYARVTDTLTWLVEWRR